MTVVNIQLFRGLALFTTLLFLGLSRPVHGQSWLEGRIGSGYKANGFFDLRIEVWSQNEAQLSLLQTIEIPKVSVQAGLFEISLEAGLGKTPPQGFTFKILSREFESWKPYLPAELSRIRST